MKGIVRFISKNGVFAAVETAAGEYSVLEITDSISLDIEDIISGDLESLGGETLRHETGEEFEVFIQDIHASEQLARQFLFENDT